MKNPPKNTRSAEKKANSPYQRNQKKPYQYPAWAKASEKGGHTPAEILRECAAVRETINRDRPADNSPRRRGRNSVEILFWTGQPSNARPLAPHSSR